MDITPLHPLIVGEATGLDLRDPIDAERLAELIAALDTYGALVFRGQSLDDGSARCSARWRRRAARTGRVTSSGSKSTYRTFPTWTKPVKFSNGPITAR